MTKRETNLAGDVEKMNFCGEKIEKKRMWMV